MKRQNAGSPTEADDTSMDLDNKQRSTSPLVPPGQIVVRAANRADELSLRRELLLGDLARRTLNDLEPQALGRVAVETIGRGLDLDVCVLLGLRGNSLVIRSGSVYLHEGAT